MFVDIQLCQNIVNLFHILHIAMLAFFGVKVYYSAFLIVPPQVFYHLVELSVLQSGSISLLGWNVSYESSFFKALEVL